MEWKQNYYFLFLNTHFWKIVFCYGFSFLSLKVVIFHIFPWKSSLNVSHVFLQQKQLYVMFPIIFFLILSFNLELHLLFFYHICRTSIFCSDWLTSSNMKWATTPPRFSLGVCVNICHTYMQLWFWDQYCDCFLKKLFFTA